MITDDKIDLAYAKALQKSFDDIDKKNNISSQEIEEKLFQLNIRFFPDDKKPKSAMLKEIHSGIIYDELDSDLTNQPQALARFKKITNDYLSGNFWPSYFMLSGNYMDSQQGFAFSVRVKNNTFIIECSNSIIQQALKDIAKTLVISNDDEKELILFQSSLPESIGNLKLIDSEILEHLTNS